MPQWTVIGVWVGSEPVPVGVVEGEHPVQGGDDSHFEAGVWACGATAETWLDAQTKAVAEMKENVL